MTELLWNTKQNRFRAPVRIIFQGCIFLILGFLFNIPVALMSFLLMKENRISSDSIFQSPLTNIISMLTIVLAIIISIWLASKYLDKRPFNNFGFHFNSKWWLDFLFGLLLGAGLMALIFIIELALSLISIQNLFVSNQKSISFLSGFIQSLILFICVGIQEEILSRGYHLTNIAEGFNSPRIGSKKAIFIGWLLSSIIFSILHIYNPNTTILSLINLTAAGLLLGLGYMLTGELGLSIGFHIAWNFFQGNIFGFPVSGINPTATIFQIQQDGHSLITGGAFGPEGGLIGLATIIIGSLIMVAWTKKKNPRQNLIKYNLADYSFGESDIQPVE